MRIAKVWSGLLALMLIAPGVLAAQDRRAEGGRGWLGIGFEWQDSNPDEARVSEVVPGSAAAEAGVRRGDTVLLIDGQHAGGGAVDALSRRLRVGDRVRLRLRRDGREFDQVVVARAAPERIGRAGPEGEEEVITVRVPAEAIRVRMDTVHARLQQLLTRMDSLHGRLEVMHGDSGVVLRVERRSGEPLRVGRGGQVRVLRDSARGRRIEIDSVIVLHGDSMRMMHGDSGRVRFRIERREGGEPRRMGPGGQVRVFRDSAGGRRIEIDSVIVLHGDSLRMMHGDSGMVRLRIERRDGGEPRMREPGRVRIYRDSADRRRIEVDSLVVLNDEAMLENLREMARVEAFPYRDLDPAVPFYMEMGRRGVAGAEMVEMNPGLARYFRVEDGVLVVQVSPATPMARAGVEAGDVIVRAGGAAVEDVGDLRRAFSNAGGDGKLRIEVIRQGSRRTLEMQWEPMRRRVRAPAAPAPARPN